MTEKFIFRMELNWIQATAMLLSKGNIYWVRDRKRAVHMMNKARTLGLHEPIAVVGIAGRYPGSSSNAVEEWYASLCTGEEPRGEIPLDRWDIDEFYDPDKSAIGKIYVRYGSFIPGVQDFDAPPSKIGGSLN